MPRHPGSPPVTDEVVLKATDEYRSYSLRGTLPGCSLEIVVTRGGRSKRGYCRYPGAQFNEPRIVRHPLGNMLELGLPKLRRAYAQCEALIEENKSPRAYAHEVLYERQQQHARNITLATAIEQFFTVCMKNRWGKKARENWPGIKIKYLDPIAVSPLGALMLRKIDHTHVAVWLNAVCELSGVHDRLHSFFHGLFNYFTARQLYNQSNPASWDDDHPLYELLNKVAKRGKVEEMHVDDVPLIVADLLTEIAGGHPGFLSPVQGAI